MGIYGLFDMVSNADYHCFFTTINNFFDIRCLLEIKLLKQIGLHYKIKKK